MSGYVKAGYSFLKNIIKPQRVSPTIKSVKPNFKKTGKQTREDEYDKRVGRVIKSKNKMAAGKKMIREAQKELKKEIDTKKAFQYKTGGAESTYPIRPGEDMKKYEGILKKDKPDKKFKTGKQLEAEEKAKAREKRMGGGMMGRRMGYSQGKLAVTPREKRLAAQYGDKKRITRGDVITAAKKKSGERMQASVGGGAGQTRKEKILFKLNKNIKNVKEKMKGPTLTKSQINTLKRKKP